MTCKKEQQHSTIIRSKMNQKNRRTYCVATCQFISFSKKLKDPSTYPPPYPPVWISNEGFSFSSFFLPETNQGLKSLCHISHTHTTHSHSCGGSFKTKTKVNLTIRSIFFFFDWHSRLLTIARDSSQCNFGTGPTRWSFLFLLSLPDPTPNLLKSFLQVDKEEEESKRKGGTNKQIRKK